MDHCKWLYDHRAQPFFEQIRSILAQLQTPAFVTNSFGDLILANPGFFYVVNIDPQNLRRSQAPHPYNFYRILFSPEYDELHRKMGDSYASFVRRRVLMLKAMTLKYRNTRYYQELIPELNQFPEFKRNWQSSLFFEEDVYFLSNIFKIDHSRWGTLNFISFPVQVPAEVSDLLLFTYQPMDSRTVEVCAQIICGVGNKPIKVQDGLFLPS